jgi:putative hydrolase
MSDLPFGFTGPNDPNDRGKGGEPSGQGPSGGPGGQFDVNQLGQMLSQLGQMLSQAGSSGAGQGPVNYDVAKQLAVQQLTNARGLAGSDKGDSVADSLRLAEMWLDPVTNLPTGTKSSAAWSPRDWVENTIPTWQRLCDPVAQRMSGAWVDALPSEAKEAAGPMLTMLGQMGGMAFGSQLGNALAQLGSEVLTSSDVGLPLGPEGMAALLPANIEEFTEGLERPASEVMVFLAAREAAHQRLFAHVPWLRNRLLAAVEEFAQGISVDTSALEEMAGQIDPSNPESIEQIMSSGMLQPQTTEAQRAALTRLETLLALVEGWVDVVVADAVSERLPGADALRETLRRRRASGGPAEQTFATLVGLELRPRKLRAASALWKLVGERHGLDVRDVVWAHPDLIPTAEELDNPTDFADRLGQETQELDDPIAAIQRAEEAEREDEPGPSDSGKGTGDEGSGSDHGEDGPREA